MSGVAGGAAVDGRALPAGVLGDVGGESQLAGVGDEAAGVVALVAGDGSPPCRGGEPGEHGQRAGPLGVPVGGGQLGVDDQRVAVLHEQVTRVAELGRGGVRLAIQAGPRDR